MQARYYEALLSVVFLCLVLGVTPLWAQERVNGTNPSAAAGEAAGNNSDILRSDVIALESRALLGLEKHEAAGDAAQRALDMNPNNTEALAVLAELSERLLDWRLTVERWNLVSENARSPEERLAADTRVFQIKDAFGPRVSVRSYFLGDSEFDEQVGLRLDASFMRESGPGIVAGLEVRDFETRFGVDRDGNLSPVDRQRWRGDVGAVFYQGRNKWTTSLVGSDDVFGARVSLERAFEDGIGGVVLEGNTPFWLYSQGAQNDAALDSVRAYFNHSSSERYVWDASLAWRNHTVDDRRSVGDSILATGGISIAFSPGQIGTRFEARYDLEYFSDLNILLDSNGEPFTELPLVDREVISVGLARVVIPGSIENTSSLRYGGGYRVDLQGNEGPYINATGSRKLTPTSRIEFLLEYSDVAAQRQSSDQFISAFLTYTHNLPF